MDQPPPARFAWVRKADGRLVQFEADKISRDLFAAGESLGKPDAFLARELTDSILHFLEAEVPDPTPSTAQIADLVVKVVRELGQPELALAFAKGGTVKDDHGGGAALLGSRAAPPSGKTGVPPANVTKWVEDGLAAMELVWQAARQALREYSLREVFARDLVAAQSEQLLTLGGLDAPLELSGWSMATVPAGDSVLDMIEEARSVAGEYLAFDGPEYVLASRAANPQAATDYAHAVKLSVRQMHLHAVINLHCSVPPSQLGELAMGPLFEAFHTAAEPCVLHDLATALLDEFLQVGSPRSSIRVDWHLGKNDFTPAGHSGLLRLAKRVLDGSPLAFVFDRPRRGIALAEGLDRHHPASLLTVFLDLPRLIEQSAPELDETLFLKKLGSLARLALSAAKQKREFLRGHAHGRPLLAGGFLLDRARLTVVPVGLETAAQMLLGRGLCSGGSAPEFARQVVQRLSDVLREDGRTCLMDTCVDSAPELQGQPAASPPRSVPGLTAWDVTATAKSQLRAASVLHSVADTGTASILLPDDALPGPEELADLLSYAWKQTEVVRVRFLRLAGPANPLPAPWEQ
jgi:hypothetical protein